MFRLLKYGVIIAIVVLVLGGVLEIDLHTDRLKDVPSQITQVSRSRTSLEYVRSWAVQTKRSTELWIIRDDDQELALAIDYIVNDSTRLVAMAEDDVRDPGILLPQAELLVGSIDQASEVIAQASVSSVADAQEDARDALDSAALALIELQQIEAEQEADYENFKDTTEALAKHINAIELDAVDLELHDIGEVAGSTDSAEAEEGEEDQSEEVDEDGIPLQF